MKSIFEGENSNFNDENNNFNLIPPNTPIKDNKQSNYISCINSSPAPGLDRNNNFNNIKISINKNYSDNDIQIKKYTNEIDKNEENKKFNLNNEGTQSILDNGQLLIDSINYGFIPFFIKIEDYNPVYLIANKGTIFKNILTRYINDLGNININDCIFYNNGEIIDKNMSLENLNIDPLSIIIGKRE